MYFAQKKEIQFLTRIQNEKIFYTGSCILNRIITFQLRRIERILYAPIQNGAAIASPALHLIHDLHNSRAVF